MGLLGSNGLAEKAFECTEESIWILKLYWTFWQAWHKFSQKKLNYEHIYYFLTISIWQKNTVKLGDVISNCNRLPCIRNTHKYFLHIFMHALHNIYICLFICCHHHHHNQKWFLLCFELYCSLHSVCSHIVS